MCRPLALVAPSGVKAAKHDVLIIMQPFAVVATDYTPSTPAQGQT